MSSEAMDDAARAERLSALVDGELDAAMTEAACRDWKGDGAARCTWHAYQVIGDVLRSEDLAGGVGRNEQFLMTLRARLAAEPVVLAPAPLMAPREAAASQVSASARRAGRWMLPSAMAAGLLLVAGTFTVLRPGGPPLTNGQAVAVADATNPRAAPAVAVDSAIEPAAIVVSGKVIRDARLDRYLAAHKQFSGSSALGLPSAFLRSATVESDAR